MKCGLSVKPNTDVSVLFPYLDKADMVLVMSVEPGFGGQQFIPGMMDKVRTLRAKAPLLNIQVDGGLNRENASLVVHSGANALVVGTGIFESQDRKKEIQLIKNILKERFGQS
eukprot:TRINITY_DN3981_c0_g1_i11.p2 TRINITY_DN3981_c0_g1~~TRINITY_DN3981_c0_g1_i11.p2  ORF type:complete len:113 (+),score=17.07 TRINITY_DN3981_c0_g1_i11:539-877(+)